MADLQKTIEIIFGGKDNLSPVTKTLTKELGSFDAAVQSAAAPIGNFTENLLKTEAAILALGLAMAGVALNQAGTFSGSIEEIGTLFNGTTEEVKQLEIALLEYARGSSSAIEEINQATYIAISTGAEWASVTETLAAAEQLATVGATDLATATGALQRTMNAYGLSTEEALRVSEALFTAVQNGDITMELLATNIGKVATIANGAGVELEVLLSAISAMTIAGLSAEESMTGLKALFTALADPSKDLSNALGGMSLETNSLQEVMLKLSKETGGTLEGFNKLFPSIRASQAAMVLGNDAAGAFNSTLQAMEDKTGNLTAAYEKMSLAFSNVNQTLVNNIRATLIQTGLPLLDEYGTAVEALGNIFAGIGEGVQAPNFQEIYSAIEVFVNSFSASMDDVANALPEAMSKIDFSAVIRAFSDLSEIVGGALDGIFGADLDLSKPEDLAKALQSAVNILTTFIDLTTGIITGLQPVFDILGEAASETGKVGEEAAKATGEILAAITLLHEFGTVLGTTLTIIKESETDITNVFATLKGAAGILTNALQLAFDGLALLIVESLILIQDGLASITLGDLGDDFERSANSLRLTSEAITANIEKNTQDMSDSWDTMTSGLSGSAAELKSSMGAIEQASKDIVDEIFNFGNAADTAGGGLDNLSEKADSAKAPVSELAEDLKSLGGVEVVDSTIPENIEKIGTSADTADEKYAGFVKTIVDGVPTFTAVASAMKETTEATKLSAKEAEDAALKWASLELELEKLASNERIKTMEFAVDFQIANVEADAKKVVAAFESISTSYASTADLVGTLFSTDAPDWDNFGFDTERAAKQATDLLEEQWEMQKKLIEAQIEQMEAQTSRMASGGALITVDGGELQPELELIMQALFKSIRIKMSSDYEDYLLALGQA